MSNLENPKQYVYPNKYLQACIEKEREEEEELCNHAPCHRCLIAIESNTDDQTRELKEKIQKLEKENKELMLNLAYRENVKVEPEHTEHDFRCECCGASEGGTVEGCDDCEIYKVSNGMWWSLAGWHFKTS